MHEIQYIQSTEDNEAVKENDRVPTCIDLKNITLNEKNRLRRDI